MTARLRDSGIGIIGDVPWGTHISMFYRTGDELLGMLVRYFKAGLLNNESCLWVTSGITGAQDAARAMNCAIPSFDAYLAKGQISIIPHTQWYLEDGRFDKQRVINGWARRHSEALSLGFDGLRVTGDTSWLDEKLWEPFSEYENDVERALPQLGMLALCTYSLDKCAPDKVIDVVCSHRCAVGKRDGKWTFFENPVRKKAEEDLRRANSDLDERITERTAELVNANMALHIEMAVRKKMEDELKVNYELLQGVMENSPAIITIKDTAGRYLTVNRRFVKDMGLTQEEVAGRTAHDIYPCCTAEALSESDRKVIETGSVIAAEEEIALKDGAHTFIVSKFPILGRDGGVQAVCGIATDITERKRIEAEKEKIQSQLFQAQKMETIGKLAAGIAHDFNNIMTIIGAYCNLARNEPGSMQNYLEQILAASERATNLTRQLLIFSRNQPARLCALNVNAVFADMLKILDRILSENITVSTFFEDGLGAVMADTAHVEQLLMNLVINAKDALPNGGNIVIKTESAVVGPDNAPGKGPGNYVRITVADNGVGMDGAVVERLFEPFFSTKGAGKGIGLGLAVVKDIVKDYNGWIDVESEPGKGSAFMVYLPSVAQRSGDKEDVKAPAPAAGAGQRILLVEDEKWLRKSVALALYKNGYKVFEAAGAKDAIAVFEKEGGRFDVVFSDMILEDDNGISLVEELERRAPGLRVLLVSGYLDIESQWPVIQNKGYRFLQKPYDVPELLRVIKEVVSSRGPAS